MEYFSYKKVTDAREAELLALPKELLDAPMDPDPEIGVKKIAALLTCLPEEEREAAVRGMIPAMLCG